MRRAVIQQLLVIPAVWLLSSMKDVVLGWALWIFWVLCWQLLLSLTL